MRQEDINGLGSYGNECTKALIQLPRPNELYRNMGKVRGERRSKKVAAYMYSRSGNGKRVHAVMCV